jgi:molybdopterin molybdotransferase
MPLLSVKAAQRRITQDIFPIGTEKVPVANGLQRVLASDILSIDLPVFDNSSVDGFAVIAGDLKSASPSSPCRLRVAADIPAGTYSGIRLKPGLATRIMTGAPIPRGASAVLMLEDTDCNGRQIGAMLPEWIHAYRSLKTGANIRRRGTDVHRGRRVLFAGKELRSQDLGLLSMLGAPDVTVFSKPRIALLSTGSELVATDRPLRKGTVRDANSITLAALIEQTGCIAIRLGIAHDTKRAIERLLQQAIVRGADLIISSGGVSVGTLDLVRDVMQEHGRLRFWRVNVRPGKPLAVGEYHGTPFIGLPGNPVSAFVGFELFVRPALARLAGRVTTVRRTVPVTLTQSINSDGRESYFRAVVIEKDGSFLARLTGHQGSGNLLSLVQANALLVVPAGVKSLAVGDRVSAWLL